MKSIYYKKNASDKNRINNKAVSLLCSLLIIFLCITSSVHAQDKDSANKALLLYDEAVNIISKKALNHPAIQDIVRESLKNYMKNAGPYSDYLSPEEYENFKNLQKNSYIGTGMEIEKDSSGKIICIPYPESPAEKSGVKFGDILKAVDGQDVSGKSFFAIGAMIRGEEGTAVVLTLENKTGKREVSIKRESIKADSVDLKEIDKIPVIRILSFTNSTQRELKDVLQNLEKNKTVVIDLRQNPGGNLHSAIDSATLFLEKGKKIVTINGADEDKSYQALGDTLNSDSSLYLLQDERTGSAAEVFIAALTDNARAVSIGKKTYGKGTIQDIIELSDGSAIFLTTAYLETPNGMKYHKQGLIPAYGLKMESPNTDDYLSIVKKLMQKDVSALTPPVEKKEEKKEEAVAPPVPEKEKPVKSTMAGLPSSPDSDTFFACFDREFDKDEDAEVWSSVLKNSFENIDNQYLLKEIRPEGVKSIVCIGPYKSSEEAEKKRLRISQELNVVMFTKVVKSESSVPETKPAKTVTPHKEKAASEPDLKPEPEKKEDKPFIQGGSYDSTKAEEPVKKDEKEEKSKKENIPSSTAAAEPDSKTEVKKEKPAEPVKSIKKDEKYKKNKDMNPPSHTASVKRDTVKETLKDEAIVYFIQTGSYESKEAAEAAKNDLLVVVKDKNMDISLKIKSGKINESEDRYRVFIGPYKEKDEVLLEHLKKENFLAEDAFWVQQGPEKH